MSDDTMHPEDGTAGEQLASQYVDGLASPQERAQVESSPQLTALAQQFSEQRSMLAAVPPPTASARDAAVAAALSQFTMVEPPPNVVSIDRRRRTRWPSAAAAVILLGVGGAVVAQLNSGDQSSDSFEAAQVETAKTNRNTGDTATGGTEGSDTFVSTAGGASTPGVTATDAASSNTAQSTQTIGEINDPVSAVPEVHTEPELRSTAAGGGAPMQPNIELACTITEPKEIVAEITWNGTPAVVVRDTVTGVITALDSQCTALATVAP